MRSRIRRALLLPLAGTVVRIDSWWLLILPPAAWALATLGIPLFAPALTPAEGWWAALLTLLCGMGSLLAHIAAHILAARRCDAPLPPELPLLPFGEPAQLWPQPRDPWRATLTALAAPLCHLLLALLAYIVWNQQLHPIISTVATLLLLGNGALALASLAPGYPLDGARITLAVAWELGFPARGALLARRIGWLSALALAIWGGVLIATQARFSLPTGMVTLGIALMLALTLWRIPAPRPMIIRSPAGSTMAWIISGIVIPLQLLGPLSLLPMVDGIYAPGSAVAVEPMITIPPERLQRHQGVFLLTTVISQTPITLGQWAHARSNPAYEIVAPERVVPRDVEPQELVRQSFQMLEESEAQAIVAALRLAGYRAELVSTAVAVQAVLEESPNAVVLQAGDLIVRVGDTPTPSIAALSDALAQQQAGERIVLTLERGGTMQQVNVTLLPPAEGGTTPRIGVSVQNYGLDLDLPFAVQITPQKIVGGPSAGLMFALTIYNMLSPDDLTGGQRVAGTGTIDIDGRVGPIGGVTQKIAAAETAGARYFVVPSANYAEAARAARTITLIPVETMQEAVEKLRSLTGD